MKNIITGTAVFFVLILLVLTLYTIQGRSAREEEIQNALSNAVRTAGEGLKKGDAYAGNEEFKAAFLENLLMQIDSASDVEVTILMADHEKGILSAEVTETYRHPNGKTGKVSCKRTLILDKQEEKEAEKSYTASFYLEPSLGEDSLYKTVTLKEGEILREPKPPEEKNGKTFAGWIRKFDNQAAAFGEGVTHENIFYAAWK